MEKNKEGKVGRDELDRQFEEFRKKLPNYEDLDNEVVKELKGEFNNLEKKVKKIILEIGEEKPAMGILILKTSEKAIEKITKPTMNGQEKALFELLLRKSEDVSDKLSNYIVNPYIEGGDKK